MSFTLADSSAMPVCVSPKQLSDPSSGSCGSGSWPTQAMLHHCKRPLETFLAAPDLIATPSTGAHHVIPNGEATHFQYNAQSLCTIEREILQQNQKRMRYSDQSSSFSGQVECSIDPLLGNFTLEQSSTATADVVSCVSDHTLIQDSLHEQQRVPYSQLDSIVWWKQRKPRRQSPSSSDGATVCYVCHNPVSTDSSSHIKIDETATSTAQKKTMLSFFTPLHTIRRSAAGLPATSSLDATAHHRSSGAASPMHPPNSTTCAHCERTDLCAECVRPCQECLASFCVFCSMIDAGGCVCLDCSSSLSMRSFNDTDEDMQID